MIPYSKQSINDDDINEVIKVLKSEMITQGPLVERFEKTICSYTSSNYSVLTNSATSALHISCLALGLRIRLCPKNVTPLYAMVLMME